MLTVGVTNHKTRRKVVLLGPDVDAVSGVSTHLRQLLQSELADSFDLLHFQVGSEGRREGALQRWIRLVGSPFAFFVFLLMRQIDLVHINTSLRPKSYWRDLAYFGVARMLHRGIVYQVHNATLPADFFAGRRLLTGLLRKVLNQSGAVVVLGRHQLETYESFAPQARVELIPNAIVSNHLTTEAIAAKRPLPLHLVYLGRLSADKGLFEALEGLALLVRDGSRTVVFSIAGDGPDALELAERVAELDLRANVRFLGPLFGPAKDALWRSGHVFVFPTHSEGLPYALLEAMAAGAVPISTQVGAIPDVVEDGVNGLLIATNDPLALATALEYLDDNRDTLAHMAEAGRRRVLEHYTITRLTEDLTKLYQRLLPTQ